MSRNRSYTLSLYWVPACLLCVLTGLAWPFYQYFVDQDAISYLLLAERYAAGDYSHAVNAFWSPMGCWLTALLVKISGWPLFASAIIVNTLPALGMVIAGQYLFHQFREGLTERWCFGLSSAIFWTYAVYQQSFTDIWQYLFLTLGLLLLLKDSFTRKPGIWVLLGVLGALAYFSKAYAFYFFPLMILVAAVMKSGPEWKSRAGLRRLALLCTVAIGTQLLLAFPWIYILKEHYGIWTTSTAGSLNLSWWLVGTQEFKEGLSVLIPPPPYPGSIFYFEDPYLVQGHFAHFWDSPRMMIKLLLRIGYNVLGWVSGTNRLSPFYFCTWLLTSLLLWRHRRSFFPYLSQRILAAVFLLYPLPFWLLTFDGGRYLWFTIPLSMVLGLILLDKLVFAHTGTRARIGVTLLYFGSYLIQPIADLKDNFRKGQTEFEISRQLKAMNIQGAFVSNRALESSGGFLHRIAYFSRSPWYCHTLNQYTNAEILQDALKYKVKYYFYFYDGAGGDYELTDPKGNVLEDITKGRIEGMKVFPLSGDFP